MPLTAPSMQLLDYPEITLASRSGRLSKSPFRQEHVEDRLYRGIADMSEDRPADDQDEGVDSAVRLSSDVLVDLVRLLAIPEALRRRS
jgi:hypothetical protein